MRVTENTNYDTIRDTIHRSRGRMENLQQQTATLKKINHPSDDPIGASKIMELRTDKMNNDQYQMNTKMAETFLNNTDHALADLSELVVRAKEIAISQSSAASSGDETRIGVAEEIMQLVKHGIATANRRIGERYLFGGFKTQTPPVDNDGKYVGDDGQMMVEIANDVFITMNIPGLEVFNTHPKSKTSGGGYEELNPDLENINLFQELQSFRISLLTGDLEGIRSTLERFDDLHSRLISVRAKVGSRLQGLQSTSAAIERHNITNAELSSSLEDVDMAQAVSDLTKEETVFRSALASSKRLIQPTLLDFLK